ncbi:MAG: ABC transporter permease subunit [Chloroflexota bacterium]|nr:ABC transporter permease subunit [Chloroflexota bacterium]
MRQSRLSIVCTLAPALGLVAVLFGASVIYGIGQSLGYLSIIGQTNVGLAAYRNVLVGPSLAAAEFWPALGFSLWVSGATTLLAALGALVLAVLLAGRRVPRRASVLALHVSLAFPHLVWAIALVLLLSQSGLLARAAAAAGLITVPADFPVLVRDRYGIGIMLDYVSKEIPFLTLILLAVLRAQPQGYDLVAENLGASAWQRLRYVTLPLVLPALLAGALLVFAFVFGAYEVPAVLGVRFPRMLAALALEFFLDPDLHSRAEGMAISVIMALVVLLVALAAAALQERRDA